MKKIVSVYAALAAMTVSAFAADLPMKAAAPQPDPTPLFSGYIGVWAEATRTTESGDRERPGGWGADARLNYWLNPAWSFQFDAEADQVNHDGSVSDNPRREALVVGHWAWRDPRVGSAGIFGGWVYPNNNNGGERRNMGLIGIEGQRYYDMLTLYGQGGYLAQFSKSSTVDQATDIWFGRFAPRYFVTPNDRLSAEVGYARGVMGDDTSDKIRIWNWAATYEHKFNMSPVSAFIQYAGGDVKSSQSPNQRTREHTFVAGLRWYFNQGTLQANDRTGATYDTPGFIRYLPFVGIAD